MARTTGIVFEAESYRDVTGVVSPPVDDLKDRSRFGNDGAMTNVIWARQSSGLYTMVFDGTAYIDIADSPSLRMTEAITLLAWVKVPNLTDAHSGIISKWATIAAERSYVLKIGLGTPSMMVSDGIVGGEEATAAQLSTATWTLAVGTYDGQNIIAYKNTTAGTPNAETLAMGINDSLACIGSFRKEHNLLYEIEIGLPRIYNYALSALDIAIIFEKERRLFGV